jgi:hypothetical protein
MSELDPRTANVSFCYGVVAGDPDCKCCTGRVYYLYDPERRLPAVDDWEFRVQHLEIDDATWSQLFYEAFDRGEARFEERMLSCCPSMTETSAGQLALGIGRLFGPRLPQNA